MAEACGGPVGDAVRLQARRDLQWVHGAFAQVAVPVQQSLHGIRRGGAAYGGRGSGRRPTAVADRSSDVASSTPRTDRAVVTAPGTHTTVVPTGVALMGVTPATDTATTVSITTVTVTITTVTVTTTTATVTTTTVTVATVTVMTAPLRGVRTPVRRRRTHAVRLVRPVGQTRP